MDVDEQSVLEKLQRKVIRLELAESNCNVCEAESCCPLEAVELVSLENTCLSEDTSSMKDVPWIAGTLGANFSSV